MDVKVEHLVKRESTYYFRWRIPKEFSVTVPLREIKCSLQTKELAKAQITCKILIQELIQILRSKADVKLTTEEIRQIFADVLKKSLDSQEKHLALFGPICDASMEDGIKHCDTLILHAREALRINDLNFHTAYSTAKNCLKNTSHDDEDIAIAAREYLKILIYKSQIQKKRLQGDYDNEYDAIDFKEILSGRYWAHPKEEVVITATSEDDREIFTLNQLIDRYVNEKVSTGAWQKSMQTSTQHILNLFLEVKGDVNIRFIRHQDIMDFRDKILMRLPRKVGNRNKLKGLSIEQIAALNIEGTSGQSVKTINIKMEKLGGFFNWCADHEYIDNSPARKMTLKLKHKAHEERQPYTSDELKKIITNLRPDTLTAWTPYKMWVALIAMFSGARQSEICQLYLDDIKVFEEIPCFIIQDDKDDKKVKTDAGHRKVPIHPALLQLGLLDYVIELKNNKQERLWPELEKRAKGYGQMYQRFFQRFNRSHITEDKRKVFHSLRHNFTNTLKQKGVEESRIAELVGHAVNSMTFGRYGKPFIPKVLLEAMNKLEYGVDVFALMDKTPLTGEQIAEQVAQLPKGES
jgi:integrase